MKLIAKDTEMEKISKRKVIEICFLRFDNHLSCNGCIYKGAICDGVRAKLQVNRPSDNYYKHRYAKEYLENGNSEEEQ